jgi:hypothetical protein
VTSETELEAAEEEAPGVDEGIATLDDTAELEAWTLDDEDDTAMLDEETTWLEDEGTSVLDDEMTWLEEIVAGTLDDETTWLEEEETTTLDEETMWLEDEETALVTWLAEDDETRILDEVDITVLVRTVDDMTVLERTVDDMTVLVRTVELLGLPSQSPYSGLQLATPHHADGGSDPPALPPQNP